MSFTLLTKSCSFAILASSYFVGGFQIFGARFLDRPRLLLARRTVAYEWLALCANGPLRGPQSIPIVWTICKCNSVAVGYGVSPYIFSTIGEIDSCFSFLRFGCGQPFRPSNRVVPIFDIHNAIVDFGIPNLAEAFRRLPSL